MICRLGEQLLQEHLDGHRTADSLEHHLEACTDCAADLPFLQRLLHGIPLLHPPVPPSDLTERLTMAVLAQPPRVPAPPKHRHLHPVLALALAASILLALGVWAPRVPQPNTPENSDSLASIDPHPAALPLQDTVEEAGSAMLALTSRTAGRTLESTATFFPTMDPALLEPLPPMPPLEPPLDPLLEAGANVSATISPLTDSARRAVGLFLRDLPISPADSDKKPG